MQNSVLIAGTKLGAYEVIGLLGQGGMGSVYRARDSKLKRDVAIKILPDEFSRDAIAAARFQHEAEALASLNHSNIGAIYDIAELNDSRFLVLELIEGETLADRIRRGPIPLEEALPIARQIAEALEAAHEKGVTHRDLKPANIKLTPGGVAKVLDFGLAKTRSSQPDVNLSNTPTIAGSTLSGTIIGTPAYMPPEQAKGLESDRTADIWSFGCVLYEMLTGRPAFEGQTFSEILAEVLKSEPNWNRLPPETPEAIRRLLRRCLRKDPKARLRDIGDARIEISDAQNSAESITATPVAAPPASRMKERIAWAALAALALAAGVIGAHTLNHTEPAALVRSELATAATFDAVTVAISPNGRKIVYSGEVNGVSALWLRSLDSDSAKPISGTAGAFHPFWSPDNRSLGFVGDNKLKIVDTENGTVRVIANAPNARGGTWGKDDIILFTPFNPGFVYQISAKGGKPQPVTQLDEGKQQANHLFASFLPDGKHFLYYNAAATPDIRGVWVQSIIGGKATRLFDSETAAIYASGYLFFTRQGTLMAHQFDPDKLALSGEPIPVVDKVPGNPKPAVSVSENGTIVYRPYVPPTVAAPPFRFAWFDRSGKEVGKFPETLAGNSHWSMTLDAHNFAQEKGTNGNIDIWRIDYLRGVRNRVTTDPVADTFPIWSPKGDRIVFTSNRKTTTYDLYVVVADQPGSDQLLLSSNENKIATDWSMDGRYILYRNVSEVNGYDVSAVPVDANGMKNGDPISVVSTPADERDAQFSPDGNFVAYQSNESGIFEIYVQPFPSGGAKYQVSKGGGSQVRWNPSGKELFYISLDGKMVGVPMKLNADGKHFEAGTPDALFPTTLRGPEIQTTNRHQWAVSTDGKQFLLRGDPGVPSTTPLSLILNWKPAK